VSSAILYVAIVAIWIGVLVPRWLRHDNTRDGHTGLRRFSRHKGPQEDADWVADAEPGAVPETDLVAEGSDEESGAYLSAPDTGLAPAGGPATELPPVPSYGWSAQEYLRHERAAQPSAPSHDERSGRRPDEHPGRPRDARDARRSAAGPGAPRSGEPVAPRHTQAHMVMARRRMLMMLIVLSLVAVAMAFLRLAAWWVAIPPTVMLAGYMMLLREAARADAELRDRQAAALAKARERAEAKPDADTGAAPAAERSAAVAPPHEPLTHAEVIDISARVSDQLYDQYADAKLRAVGD
jgi:hypothetical protein